MHVDCLNCGTIFKADRSHQECCSDVCYHENKLYLARLRAEIKREEDLRIKEYDNAQTNEEAEEPEAV